MAVQLQGRLLSAWPPVGSPGGEPITAADGSEVGASVAGRQQCWVLLLPLLPLAGPSWEAAEGEGAAMLSGGVPLDSQTGGAAGVPSLMWGLEPSSFSLPLSAHVEDISKLLPVLLAALLRQPSPAALRRWCVDDGVSECRRIKET